MSPQIHPNGFRISERPVAASFAHIYSFQLLSDPMQRDEASIPSSMTLGGMEGGWVRYWDEASTVAVLEFNVVEPVAQQPHAVAMKEKKKKSKGSLSCCRVKARMLITTFISCRPRRWAIGSCRTVGPSYLQQTRHAELQGPFGPQQAKSSSNRFENPSLCFEFGLSTCIRS